MLPYIRTGYIIIGNKIFQNRISNQLNKLSKRYCQQKSSTPTTTTTSSTQQAEPKLSLDATYRPTPTEKKYLVWTGKYKSVDEVPAFVKQEVMERTRNKMRIKVANIMMALTIVGCIIMVISGKRASERGESVVKDNLDWHKKYNESITPNDKTATKN